MSIMQKSVHKSRLEQLRIMLEILAESLDTSTSGRDLSQLARQYRETLKEIEEIERMEDTDDEVSEILKSRKIEGKTRAIRQNRSEL